MLNNGNKINCGFASDMVAYLYDEPNVVERAVFETHLADCRMCTDEFAAISNARFSVFEWRREEFAHLSTPEIVIPYTRKEIAVEENAQVGFLAGLRGLFGISGWPVVVAASLLVCLGVGFIAMNYLSGDQQIAANVNVERVHNQNVNILDSAIDIDVPLSQIARDNPAAGKNINSTGVHTVKAVGNHRPNRQLTAETQKAVDNVPQRNTQNRKAPVLSNFDDNDDKSLRLSDLFEDEVGAKR